ncbi:hypothetical protein A3A70_02495 [candidate division WWE3 bacterium RIFCSPLOWO2_01_FULL_42_11]|uniref:Glycosyltransferase subfamily 4-like N-terminal domain-containing protein n=1 Tax=candidate division WWE3 bacterium RIFCSPLOWO2_01_FULL_42_11 TaxID=1802627 RepID=A0A1F4VR46_UNCKA|nr:MAG: hypothetical protein A3A70_02495 [candidate division WWE3 bacterium RIFCSPLOWO2_01_FULL_42_11]
MKICIFGTSFFPQIGGSERFIDGLARNLHSNGHMVKVLVPNDNILATPYDVVPLRGLRLGVNQSSLIPILLTNLILLHRHFKFEILQVVSFTPAGVAAHFFKKLHPEVKLIIRATGSDVQFDSSIGYGLRLMPGIDAKLRQTVLVADACVANSKSVGGELIGLGAAKKTVIIPNGIDINRFEKSHIKRTVLRKEITGVTNGRIILSVGRIEVRKNYSLLLTAFAKIIPEIPKNVYLVIVGSRGKDLLPEIKKLKIQKRIKLLGTITPETNSLEYPAQKLIELYLASELFAFPSLLEGQPNVLLEAMAARLPIVACNAPGSRDVVKNKKNGELVKPALEAFSTALLKLITSKSLRTNYSNYASKEIDRYNWEKVVKKYEELYSAPSVYCKNHALKS